MTRATAAAAAIAYCVGLWLGLGVEPVAADTPVRRAQAIEVDRDATPPGRIELGFDGGAPLDGWGLSVAARWLERPIALAGGDGAVSYPVRRRQSVVVGGALALADSVVLDARAGFAHQVGDRLRGAGDPLALDRWVPGDVRIGARIQVTGARRAVFVRGELTLPSGDDGDFAGEASWALAWSLIGRLTLPADVVIAGSAGVRLRGAEVVVGDRLVGDELFGALGVAVPVPPLRPLWWEAAQVRLTGELIAAVGDNVADARGPSPVELRFGVVTQPTASVAVGVRAGFGIADEIGAPRAFAMIEVAYRGRARLIPRLRIEAEPEAEAEHGHEHEHEHEHEREREREAGGPDEASAVSRASR